MYDRFFAFQVIFLKFFYFLQKAFWGLEKPFLSPIFTWIARLYRHWLLGLYSNADCIFEYKRLPHPHPFQLSIIDKRLTLPEHPTDAFHRKIALIHSLSVYSYSSRRDILLGLARNKP